MGNVLHKIPLFEKGACEQADNVWWESKPKRRKLNEPSESEIHDFIATNADDVELITKVGGSVERWARQQIGTNVSFSLKELRKDL